MLELIFQGFMEWAYGLALECWEYFSSSLLDIMSMDYAYMKSHVPVMVSIAQVLLAVGWALLIGNLVFQALKSMAVGLGFEGEDPKLLFTRTFVFAFLLMASPQICEVGLSLTARIIELLEIPDAINVTLVDEGVFGSLGAAWLLVIIFGLIIMFKVFRLLLEIAERYVILAVLTMTAPLAFAMGGSKSTSEIFGGWCRMFGSMCTLMVTNVIFFKMLLSVLSNVPSGLNIIPWIVLVLTIVKVARKADAIITRIGLNPAITGDSLGRGFPGTLTYMVMRSATSHITKTIGKSTGKGNRGAASGSTTGGPRIGGGPSGAHNAAGHTASYGEAYHCLHAPIHLLSCDKTGAQQLQIMTVPDYRVKLTRLMLRSAYQPPPEDIAAWDGLYNGHPFVIGADMDLRRIDTAVRTAKQHGCLPIALAALEGQGSAVLLQRYADPGCATVYKVTENVLSELLGRAPNLYVPTRTQFLTEKGDVVDAPLIKAPGKAGGPHRK